MIHLPVIQKIIADCLCINEDAVIPSEDLRADLGMDSLDTVDIFMEIEEYFDIDIESSEISALTTVASLHALIETHLAAKPV